MMDDLTSESDSYDTLFEELRSAVADARREWSAGLLCAFPERQLLKSVATETCQELGSFGVQVNAILDNRQITIATAPTDDEASIPADHSLCSLTVGLGKPVALSDASDGFLDGHPLIDRGLGSWASVPLMVEDQAAGSVCAIEMNSRDWTDADQAALQRAADRISRAIELWLEEN